MPLPIFCLFRPYPVSSTLHGAHCLSFQFLQIVVRNLARTGVTWARWAPSPWPAANLRPVFAELPRDCHYAARHFRPINGPPSRRRHKPHAASVLPLPPGRSFADHQDVMAQPGFLVVSPIHHYQSRVAQESLPRRDYGAQHPRTPACLRLSEAQPADDFSP